jgi:hypothetical protein
MPRIVRVLVLLAIRVYAGSLQDGECGNFGHGFVIQAVLGSLSTG